MWLKAAKCRSDVLLFGKTAIITGSNTGIGKETARDFYKRGARVIVACRDLDKANVAIEDIKKGCRDQEHLGTLVVSQLDLASLSLVRRCAQDILNNENRIDFLINNAGVMISPEHFTEDGYETTFAVNHLGHFLFTLLLLPRIINSSPARIINLSSVAHKQGVIQFDNLHFKNRPYTRITAYRAYAQSKLANVLFTKELARRLEGRGNVTVYSVHPGVVRSELGRNMNLIFPGLRRLIRFVTSWSFKTPEEGAQTTLHCALDEQAGNETGLYYSDCRISETGRINMDDAKKLWDASVKLVGLDKYDPFKL